MLEVGVGDGMDEADEQPRMKMVRSGLECHIFVLEWDLMKIE